ncbi:hypothetical protein CB1_001783013 [Camelus ferus]|nr:hypothetical protein CB1_001783013 [Camelus ferus]
MLKASTPSAVLLSIHHTCCCPTDLGVGIAGEQQRWREKFAGTLSDGLGKTMDTRHQSEREYIRYHAATSGEHLVAGIHGLAHVLEELARARSPGRRRAGKRAGETPGRCESVARGSGHVDWPVPLHPFCKQLVLLHFWSLPCCSLRICLSLECGHQRDPEMEKALQEVGAPRSLFDCGTKTLPKKQHILTVKVIMRKGAKGSLGKPEDGPRTVCSDGTQAQRVRKPRCCAGPQGLLPRYSESQAEGQEQLFKLTDDIQDEFYCVLISSKAVYFLKSGDYVDREAIFLEVKYDDLYHCLVSKDHGKVYVQVTKKAVNTSSGVSIPGPAHQKPMVHVKSEVLAVKLSQEINYAKSLYYEQQLMLRLSENQDQLELDS